MKFDSLPLNEQLLRGLEAAGYEEATPVQEQAIPRALKGRDLVACAQTGTGKTAAFSLPLLQRLLDSDDASTGAAKRRKRSGRRVIRALILAPTRELAGQISSSLKTYGRFSSLKNTVIYGGIRQGPQVRALQTGVDILVATPGRLLDLIGQGYIDLSYVEVLVLDEADRMLDMGFIHDLRKIVSEVPSERQTLMFSATMPREIRELADEWLTRPTQVNVASATSTPELVTQAVYFVEKHRKAATLTQFLRETSRSRTLVFSRTKHGADKIARFLKKGGIRALSLHGGKSQAQRQAVMREFKSPRAPVLIATDLAARGLDISDISHVINYDLPDTPETYVHRIGRTARAGASGKAVSFCERDERHRIRIIERVTGQPVAVEKLSNVTADASVEVAEPQAVASEVQTEKRSRRRSTEDNKPRSKYRSRRSSGRAQAGSSGSKRVKRRRFA